MKKNLKLDTLKVKSFVTILGSEGIDTDQKVKGGTVGTHTTYSYNWICGVTGNIGCSYSVCPAE